MKLTHVVALSCALGAVPAIPMHLPAQNGDAALALPRIQHPPTLDGIVDEPAWLAIEPLSLTQFSPDPGAPLRERSEIRVAYDDEHLYASGVFAVQAARRIRANSLVRDLYAEDDYLNLVIDTFNDRQNAVWFIVTPNATRIDGALTNDAEGPGSRWNRPEYDMVWDAAAVHGVDGWSVEVRIPLASLRFQSVEGRVTMGIIAARLISDGKERYIYPAILPTRAVAQFKPSLSQRVTLEGVGQPRLRTFAAYALFGRERYAAVTTGPVRPLERRSIASGGADLKLGLSSRITLDLTANTDFAQAETDDQQVNLSRFSLFFPEKRKFFLERAGVFDFITGGNDRLFYSRRIGLGADGRPIRILGGGRVIGRAGSWDFGALDLVSKGDEGYRNAMVVRVRRDLGEGGAYVGAIVTSEGDRIFGEHRAVGADGTFAFPGDNFLVWSTAATTDSAASGSAMDATALRAAWERRRRTGLFLSTALSRIGDSYRPALGFVLRPGTITLEQTTGFGWLRQRGRVREHAVAVKTEVVTQLRTRNTETVVVEPSWSGSTARGASTRLFVRATKETVSAMFCLDATLCIPPGEFIFREAGAALTTPPGALARVGVEVQGGTFYDGSRVTAVVSPSWSLSRHVELSGDAEMHRVWRDRAVFRADVARFRSRLSLDARLSLTGSVQYNRASRATTTSLRVRRNWREGTDLYVVLNDERLRSRSRVSGATQPGARYVAVKYVHTLR